MAFCQLIGLTKTVSKETHRVVGDLESVFGSCQRLDQRRQRQTRRLQIQPEADPGSQPAEKLGQQAIRRAGLLLDLEDLVLVPESGPGRTGGDRLFEVSEVVDQPQT